MAANTKIERLTPLDLLMPKTYIATVLTFRTTESNSVLFPALQAGLDCLSKRLPWLSGCVFPTTTHKTGKPNVEIRWNRNNNAATLLDKGSIAAEYESLSALGMPPVHVPTEIWPVPAMIDDNSAQNGAPVFAASIFRFADDKAVGLCVCMHHNAVDATGFAEVLRLWTEDINDAETRLLGHDDRLSRLSSGLSPELDAVSGFSSDALFTSHPEYSRIPPSMPTSFPSCICKLFGIPMSKVTAAKERLRENTPSVLTTNSVVCAIVWSSVARARQSRDPNLGKETSRLVTAVNGRRRIAEDFSTVKSPYFGNVVLYSLAEVDGIDLSAASLASPPGIAFGNVCSAISRSQSSDKINSRHIAEVFRLVDSVQDYRAIFPGWDLFNTRDLTITSWADLNLYELDFGTGLGKPDFIRVRYTEADGVAIILPKRKPVKGEAATDIVEEVVEIMLMLRTDDMNTLEQDETWRAFVS